MLINEIAKPKKKSKYTQVAHADWDDYAKQVGTKIATYIKKNCRPWLNQARNGADIIYRGITDAEKAGTAFVKDTRIDRAPMDTGQHRHKIFDLIIGMAGGKANRSNSMFCSGDKSVADGYGTAYVLIPIGKFNYTWSPHYSDWTQNLDEYEISSTFFTKVARKKSDALDNKELPYKKHQALSTQIDLDPKNYDIAKLKKFIKVNTGLPSAINSEHEIMIQATAGLYINANFYEAIVCPILKNQKIIHGYHTDAINDYESNMYEDTDSLIEGKNDPHILKAVFMIGGPGSGKTAITKQLLGGSGLRPINVDSFYEMMMAKNPISGGYKDELYKHAGIKMEKRLELLVNGRIGLILDGTGRKIDRIIDTKSYLEKLGYDTMAIFVDTDLDTALDRNDNRTRRVEPEAVKDMHAAVRKNLDRIKSLFNGSMIEIDNTSVPELTAAQKIVNKFINGPAKNPNAKKWLQQG